MIEISSNCFSSASNLVGLPIIWRELNVPEFGIGERKCDSHFVFCVVDLFDANHAAILVLRGAPVSQHEFLPRPHSHRQNDKRPMSVHFHCSRVFGDRNTVLGESLNLDGNPQQHSLAASRVGPLYGRVARRSWHISLSIISSAALGIAHGNSVRHSATDEGREHSQEDRCAAQWVRSSRPHGRFAFSGIPIPVRKEFLARLRSDEGLA
jgi:hypothetical protein